MSELTYKAKVENGELKFYAEDYVSNALKQFFNDKEVYITIKKYTQKRSIKQNNWYYGIAIPMVQNFLLETQGEKYSKDDIHQYHLNTVVKPAIEVKPIFGTPCTIYKIQRTSEMNTVEFMDFKEKVQRFWEQFDLHIPDPDETNMI